ncbi:MAG: serine/threonine-protein kinase [Gemmataceae bacterium]
MAVLPAAAIGDFTLLDRLGSGGMGTVYKATQRSKDRTVALKVLHAELTQRPGFVSRFHREVRMMGRLTHPHVVRCFAAGQADGHVYLAMELADAGSVGDWVKRLGRLPVGDAVRVARDTAVALGYAHGLSLIHRDVKPDNILLTAAGGVKLADLGLAKATDDSDTAMTQTGVGIGTPLYAPPEQIVDAKRADPRSDLYALGGVLYFCLTGRPPFPAGSLVELLQAKEKGEFPSARSVERGVPVGLDRIVGRLLAKEPDARYQSADELVRDLDWPGLAAPTLSFLAT